MNADAFRHVYNYHFAENRKIWDKHIMSLSQAQFLQELDYSVGSVRNQIVHLMSVDMVWFKDLRGVENLGFLDPNEYDERDKIRARWDEIEANMRAYLAILTDDMLFTKPLEGEDKDLIVWQVLLQVINHGTDHRAQLLRQLHDLGVETQWQDYVFYAYAHTEDFA